MKANEFVKLVGMGRAKQHIKAMDIQNWHNDFYNNLNRLVESHDLVLLFDDLDCAKAWINDLCEDWPYQVKGSDNKFFKWQLEQAIADVESCMEEV